MDSRKTTLAVTGAKMDDLLKLDTVTDENKNYKVASIDAGIENPDAILLTFTSIAPNLIEGQIRNLKDNYKNSLIVLVPINVAAENVNFVPQMWRGYAIEFVDTSNKEPTEVAASVFTNIDRRIRSSKFEPLVKALDELRLSLKQIVLPYVQDKAQALKSNEQTALLRAIKDSINNIINKIEIYNENINSILKNKESKIPDFSLELEAYQNIIEEYRQVERSYLLSAKAKGLLSPSITQRLFQSAPGKTSTDVVAEKMQTTLQKMEKISGVKEKPTPGPNISR